MKLTESMLRSMIKQVLKEMYDDSEDALQDAVNDYALSGFDTVEEVAERNGVDPKKLHKLIDRQLGRYKKPKPAVTR
jgi:hypothetical protein